MREENEVASHGDAFRADAQRRYWEKLVAKHRVIRQALPVGDQVLNIAELQVFVRGQIVRGREAWAELYASLAALATLREVTDVAPEFGEHLRAAAECLLPFVRTPGLPAAAPAALTPLGEAMARSGQQVTLRELMNAQGSAMAQQCNLTNRNGRI